MGNRNSTEDGSSLKEVRSVERALNNAYQSTEHLNDAIGELHHRLNPVLSPDEPKDAVAGDPEPAGDCKLAQDLDCLAARNFVVVSRIRRILHDLEL